MSPDTHMKYVFDMRINKKPLKLNFKGCLLKPPFSKILKKIMNYRNAISSRGGLEQSRDSGNDFSFPVPSPFPK